MTCFMPFGKYKGVLLSEIPSDYLQWLVSGKIILSAYLHVQVSEELLRRGGGGAQYSSQSAGNGYYDHTTHYGYQERPLYTNGRVPVGVTREAALRIIEDGRRAAAKKVHPDAGGDGELMKAVNITHDWLVELVLRALGS